MTLEGKAVVIDRDNVDSDTLYPEIYLDVEDPEEMSSCRIGRRYRAELDNRLFHIVCCL